MGTSKRFKIAVSALVCATLLFTSNAWAGHGQRYYSHHSDHRVRHVWEGVAIGVGAAILGAALINSSQTQTTTVQYAPQPSGHYEYRRMWVGPQYEKVWVQGHYTHHGQWVPGHWDQQLVRPGYYTQQRVWVAY